MFRHSTRIQYADCTVGNHVYYGRYLDLLEAARGELFRTVGEPLLKWQERGVIFPVFEARLRYREAARYDDVVVIELWLTRLRKAFLDFGCRIVKESGAVVLEAETRHVCTGLNERPRSLPPELLTALQPYLRKESASA
jgi:acyl-CoA thioester hydrolase